MGSPSTIATTRDKGDLVEVTAPALPDPVREYLAGIARALADRQRIEILYLLAVAQRPVCVLDLEHHLDLAQSTVSHHLKVLIDAGLCLREPRGRWTYYSTRADAVASFRHQLERLVHFPGQLFIDSSRSERE